MPSEVVDAAEAAALMSVRARLYQSGRQGEALDALGQARRMLRDELGLDPGTELLALEQAILRQDPQLERAESLTTSLVCPYRGLLPYESDDAETFFGREADVEACLVRLRTRRVVAVVGPSGSGKSSLVRAGVIAALQDDDARVLVTTPGTRPLDGLGALPSRPPFPVLVVDQGEEAVTQCSDPVERAAYLDRLAAYEGPLVLALRADRLGELSTHAGFARLVERGLYLLSPMSEDNLRAAIEGPARQAGLRLEPGLVDLLVREVEGEPGALPMLSHVLRQTWERREGPTLTVDGYRATGGIQDAVAQSAEVLYAQFDERQQAQVRALFLRLVTPGDDGAPIRARVPTHQLAIDESHERLIDLLATARLISSDAGDVQVAHEALAREWPRLRSWLEDDIEGQRVLRHLTAAAEGWDAMGRPESELYRGGRLAGATEWADRHLVELTGIEQSFLDGSRVNAERELRSRARTNRRLRLALGAVCVMLTAALVAGIAAVSAARRSDEQARIADSRRLSAEALTTVHPDVAVLLALHAVQLDDSPNLSALYDVLGSTGPLVAVARGEGLAYADVSPDGRTVAVSSTSGVDAQSHATYDAQDLSRTGGRRDLVTHSLDYSPDGRYLVVAASAVGSTSTGPPGQHPVRILDAQTLEEVGTYGGFAAGAYVDRDGVKFSADGSRLAAVAWQGTRPLEAMVWDTGRPSEPIRRISLVDEIYGRVQLSPDGTTIYIAQRSGPNSLRAFDVDTGALLLASSPRWRGEREAIIALSPDGSTLARSDVDGVAVLDSRTFERRLTLSGVSEGVSALDFSPDGTRIAAGYADGAVVVWDLPTHSQVHAFRGHTKEITDVTFHPDGQTVYSLASDGLLLAWDLGGTRGFPGWRSFPAQPGGFDLARSVPSPDGTKVLYHAYNDSVWRQSIQFRDLETGDLTPLQEVGRLNQYLWSPDSSVVLTAGSHRDGTSWLQTWDPETGNPVQRSDPTTVESAVYTSDGTAILAIGSTGTISRLDPATLEIEGPAVAHLAPVEDWDTPIVSPDDRTVVQRRWFASPTTVADLASGSARDVAFDSYPFMTAFSPDGSELVVFFGDETWSVLDVPALREGRIDHLVDARPFPSNLVWDMTYTADGDQLITTGNGVVELWDAQTLERLGSLAAGTRDDVASARPMPDGHTVVIAHPQGQVLTWDTRRQHLLDVACRLAGRNLTSAEWSLYVERQAFQPVCPGNG